MKGVPTLRNICHQGNVTCADGGTKSEAGVCGNIRGFDEDGRNDADPSTPFRFNGVIKFAVTPDMLGASAFILVLPGSFLAPEIVGFNKFPKS